MVERRDVLHLGLGAAVPAFYRDVANGNVRAQGGGGGAIASGPTDLAAAGGASHIGIADGGTVQSAISIARTPAALLASSVTPAEGSTIRTSDGFAYEVAARDAANHDLTTAGGVKLYHRPGPGGVNGLAFGAVGDGSTNNTAALQAALDFAAKHNDGIRAVYLPSGVYRTGTIYLPIGVRFFGESGASETTVNTGTKLVQAGDGDVIRFVPYIRGANRYWWGEIADLTIWGDNTRTIGWGINFKDVAGNSVNPQDSNFLHHLTIRRMYEGGINLPAGAFPMCVANSRFTFNNGPGIKLTRTSTFQSIHFLNISGDGNNGGLISLEGLNDRSGSVLVTNLKSEARVNLDYANAEHQLSAIVVENCDDCPIVVQGATHTSSIPGGRRYKKPGSLIEVSGAGTPPDIRWTGVAIRVGAVDIGTDPFVIDGTISSRSAQATYRQTSGSFNGTHRLFNARLALSWDRARDGDTSPSVAQHNALLLESRLPVLITAFDDAIEGQVLHVIAGNDNATLADGATLRLAGRRDFSMAGNDSCTLIYVAGAWRELCRNTVG